MPGNRDNFSKPVIRKLAERVAFLCSCPDCRNPTLGPSSDPDASVNLGKAAHITAAAKGGPRYDPTLTALERRSIQNGIWLCAIHADLVDKDEAAYSVMLLRTWKEQAEKQAANAAFTNQGGRTLKVVYEVSEEDRSFLRSLSLPPEETTEVILPRLTEAARRDIQAFVDVQEAAPHAIPLDLTLLSGSGEVATSLAGLARGISVSDEVALVSPPGTGKTTTLIQLAETVLGSSDKVPVYIPLSEWEGTGITWFETLTRRNAFKSFKPEHFMQLAYEGRLVLLLDGWNELSPEATAQAHVQLSALQRDFPQLGTAIGTRQQAHAIEAPTVRVEPLHEDQQLELARRLRGAEGERLVDQAWRTPGLRELVRIPLYLKALLLGVRGDTLPDTKDAVLSSFARQHESVPEKAVLLRSRVLGLHPEILAELASTANATGTTALTEEQARRSVADAVARLQSNGQLTGPLQPATVIDTLVDSHLLTRTSAASNVSFQHQQFQEWFASLHVERLMLAAATGDARARQMLREAVLDRPPWEESILFACERLSRKDQNDVTAVATAIIDTLGIDPMLAAEMIQRSGANVWKCARDQVMQFAGSWHTPGHIDRSLKFMMMTGQADFASAVWPFLEHSDSQVYLHALRLAEPFRPSVLGPDAARRLAGLSDVQRGHVIAGIAHQSGYDGMDLAATVARIDKNPQVIAEVIEALEFRGAMRHVTEILEKADECVWQVVTDRGIIRDLFESAQRTRLAAMRRDRIDRETDPVKRAQLLLHSRVDGVDAEGQLRQTLTSEALGAHSDQGRSLVQEVARHFPTMAAEAMVSRLQAGRTVPRGVEDLLDTVPAVDSGPIAEAALKPDTKTPSSPAVRRLIGPLTVGNLIDAFVALKAKLLVAQREGRPQDKATSDEYFAYRDAITESRQQSFLSALIERAGTTDVHAITSLADLLHLHGRRTDHAPMVLSPEDRGRLVAILLRWSETLLVAPEATRHHVASVMQAMARVPAPAFVPVIDSMLQRDLAETAGELEEMRRNRKTPVRYSYDNWYRATLAAIGDTQVSALMVKYLPDLSFGVEAAHVLLDLWNRDHPSGKDRRFALWHDYSEVKARRGQLGANPPVSGESAEAIWKIVRQYGASSEPLDKQRHAVKLACIAMRMPFGVNRREAEEVFKLPLPYAAKQDLFVVAAMSGVVISSSMLTEAIRELLRDAQTQSWRLDENRGELMTWIEIFAFSDQPLAVLGSLDLLSPDQRAPYRLRRLLAAVGQSPHSDSVKVLKALAERDPSIAEDDDWFDALVRLDSVDAARTLLESLCSGTLGGRQRQSRHRFSDRLNGFAKAHPAFKGELLRRYSDAAPCKARDILESALLESADPDALLAVVHSMASRGEDFDHRLSSALRKLAIGQTPSARWLNAVELFSVPLTAFRKQLFALLADHKQARLAQRCLEELDQLRDEYGRVKDEPRHPDIATGRPWPIVAKLRASPSKAE